MNNDRNAAEPAGSSKFVTGRKERESIERAEVLSYMSDEDVEKKVEDMFTRADDLMINKEKFEEAKQIYLDILELDPDNIDGLNSVATCIKFLTPPSKSHFSSCLSYY